MGATVDSSQIPLSTSLWWETVFHKQVQCETPTGSQVLMKNLLQHGLLSTGSRVEGMHEPDAAQAFHRVTCPSGTSTCFCVEFSMDCRWISTPSWTSIGCRGTAALPGSASCAAEEYQLWWLLLLHWSGCLQSYFSHIFPTFSSSCCCADFSFFLP